MNQKNGVAIKSSEGISSTNILDASEVCLEKALFISRDIGDGRGEFDILRGYAVLYLCQDKIKDSLSCLHLCIEKYEELRYFLGANDQFKTSFLEDTGIFPYKRLSTLLCDTGNARDALYVEELYKVPFAALSEKEGAEYLSETHKIRIIPSLTTLKNIQDSPEDYHSNTGALVIGNPKVNWLQSLPAARKEAEMVGQLVGVPPLVEEKATKQAVLERISSVSLIHFAAHGNAERGEIALSPNPCPNSQTALPPMEAYMLTMADVSRVKVRAKLVVLSCCHSGSGEIRAEGVIGIARAFLGSGARSVLVALWAIPDSATEQLMSRFYEHLIEGGSASESLHQAMKWMRKNPLKKISDWASFTLIGDDVRLEFDNQRQDSVRTGKKTPIE
ncbi:tetratricopeptide repeat protein 28-like [Pocillopora verrucosa]|uniref:tetratricopeptide repeat protein 28-like n=1 Tax=Pocillopora verrucosa TaxID=203993 RepID=UPI00333FE8DE